MGVVKQRLAGQWRLRCFLIFCLGDSVLGQIRYSVPEELERGAAVGNIAKELGISTVHLKARGPRVVSKDKKQFFRVDTNSGDLVIAERIDREGLCVQSAACTLHVELVIDNPLEMHRLEIEIVDVNDNAPSFHEEEFILSIVESSFVGTKFPVEQAIDLDIGSNSVQNYMLSPNSNFDLNIIRSSENSRSVELILNKLLDREERALYELILTAFDDGNPKKSGTVQIHVHISDANDNAPIFDQAVYRIQLLENAPMGTMVAQVTATDIDEGPNSEVTYGFNKRVPSGVRQVFSIDELTGVITVQGLLDFEDSNVYELLLEATDKGPHPIAGHCKVVVEIIDENDNAPEITATSLSSSVPEDAPPGAVIALLIVSDKDSGDNGKVDCTIPAALPFAVRNTFTNHYSLVLKMPLDRESTEEHSIPVTATDRGAPALPSTTTLTVRVSDANDNSPRFAQPSYSKHLTENNVPGTHLFTISAADSDLQENGYLTYSLTPNTIYNNLVSINAENGKIYALKSFDYEEMRHFQFHVHAKDAGTPSLSSNVSVDVFILDQNDNSPVVLLPDPGTAHLAPSTSLGLVGLCTGEIRTSRSIEERDGSHQRLILRVKDQGEPARSSTVTLRVSFIDNNSEMVSEFIERRGAGDSMPDLNLYLVIAIAFISFIFLLTVIICVALKVYGSGGDTARCAQPSCLIAEGSLPSTQSNSYNVCLRNSKIDFLDVTGACLLSLGSHSTTGDLLAVEGTKGLYTADLVCIDDGTGSTHVNRHIFILNPVPAAFPSETVRNRKDSGLGLHRVQRDSLSPSWCYQRSIVAHFQGH
ncbi:hypothetical protein NDU88_006430 [Pleurodeles waltl]|uniref:Cadherin domain-containing protein n=1 Tax=Pleurodeles waltl TaxID=8319 RepID=A0AAV7PQM3_PLEWA|nr:hypothetical protein NDU88_006430 [Pleurodeles waltl]